MNETIVQAIKEDTLRLKCTEIGYKKACDVIADAIYEEFGDDEKLPAVEDVLNIVYHIISEVKKDKIESRSSL